MNKEIFFILFLFIFIILFSNNNFIIENFLSNDVNLYIINLDRSKLRWKNLNNEFKNFNLYNINRFSGIDGKKLLIKNLIKNNIVQQKNKWWFRLNVIKNAESLKGSIGCALSHIKLWKKIYKSNDKYSLILEDDVIISFGTKKINETIEKIVKSAGNNWDIIFLGGSRIYADNFNDDLYIAKYHKDPWFNCGLFSYIVNKKSIPKLLKIVLPIDSYLDFMLNRYYGKGLNVFYSKKFNIKHNNNLPSERIVKLDGSNYFYKNARINEIINKKN